MKKILLLDIENSHKTENEIQQFLSQYQYVYLVYAKSPMCISLDGLVALSPYVMNEKLKIFKMPKMGKDSADFGLTFIAGQLSTQVKADEYSFDIMSNDKKFEYIVDLLTNLHFQAVQIKHEVVANKSQKPEKCTEKISKKEQEQLLKVVNLLKNTSPKKLVGLQNCLKSWLKITETAVKAQIELLKKYQLIRIEHDAVSYSLNRMDSLMAGQLVQKPSPKQAQQQIKQQAKPVLTSQPKQQPKEQPKQQAAPNAVSVTKLKQMNSSQTTATQLIATQGNAKSVELNPLPAIYEIVKQPLLQNVKFYCDYLAKTQNSRPSQLKSLQNSVNALFRFEHKLQLKEMMNLLKQYKVISSTSKLVYHNDVIEAWASLDLSSIFKEKNVAA